MAVDAREPRFTLAGRRVFVAGHRGMVGSALIRRLQREACTVLTAPRPGVDLRVQAETDRWMDANRPDVVVIAAARVGGILANDLRPAEFLYDNLMIAANLVHAAWRCGVARLLFLGSSCIYPKLAPQPMTESVLLTGPLEPTNQWYAVAKIAGIKLCQAYRRQYGADFIAAMPANLYGPGDNFDLAAGHVIPALMRKLHEAKNAGLSSVTIWGSGTPRREFLHVDDLADALVFLLQHYSEDDHVNVGTGVDLPIGELAGLIADVVGFRGGFVYDTSKPDGAPQKLLDTARLSSLGWTARIGLQEGLTMTYAWLCDKQDITRAQAQTFVRTER